MPKKKVFKKRSVGGSKKAMKITPAVSGLLQALVALVYILLLVLFISKGAPIFEGMGLVTGPIMVLSLVITSVLWMVLSLLGYPAVLCSKNQVYKALEVVAYTFFWLLVAIAILVFLAVGL